MVSSDASWTLQLEFVFILLAAQPTEPHQAYTNHDDGHFSKCNPLYRPVDCVNYIFHGTFTSQQSNSLHFLSFEFFTFSFSNLSKGLARLYSRRRKDLENHSTISNITFKICEKVFSSIVSNKTPSTNDLCFAVQERETLEIKS